MSVAYAIRLSAVRFQGGEDDVRPSKQLGDLRCHVGEALRVDHSRHGMTLRMFQAGDRILDLARWGFGVTTF
jgi:hypothetical protein